MKFVGSVQLISVLSYLTRTCVLSAEIDYSSSSTTVAVSSLLPAVNQTLIKSSPVHVSETQNTSLVTLNGAIADNSTNYQLIDPFDDQEKATNDTGIWTRVTSTYSRITTQFSPFSPRMEKRGMKDKNMMKMMKMTSKMNMMTNMMNAMMKYKMKKKKMKYKYKTKKMKYKLAKEKEKNKMKKYKMKKKYKSCSKGHGKKSQFVNVQKVSFKPVPVPYDAGYKKKGHSYPEPEYGGYAEPEYEYGGGYAEPEYGYGNGFKSFPEPEFYPFPEPEVYPVPEPEITVNKKFVNYNYDYNDYSSFPGMTSTAAPTTIDYYEYEYESSSNDTRRRDLSP